MKTVTKSSIILTYSNILMLTLSMAVIIHTIHGLIRKEEMTMYLNATKIFLRWNFIPRGQARKAEHTTRSCIINFLVEYSLVMFGPTVDG